jgi:hypothetical protein
MTPKGCRIKHAYLGGDKEIFLRKKKCLRTSVLFSSASIVVIRNLGSGIHNKKAHTKVLC